MPERGGPSPPTPLGDTLHGALAFEKNHKKRSPDWVLDFVSTKDRFWDPPRTSSRRFSSPRKHDFHFLHTCPPGFTFGAILDPFWDQNSLLYSFWDPLGGVSGDLGDHVGPRRLHYNTFNTFVLPFGCLLGAFGCLLGPPGSFLAPPGGGASPPRTPHFQSAAIAASENSNISKK